MPSASVSSPSWHILAAIALAAVAAVATLAASSALAQGSGRPLLKKYIGNADTDALLKEPGVRAPPEAMLGKQLPQLLRSANVQVVAAR